MSAIELKSALSGVLALHGHFEERAEIRTLRQAIYAANIKGLKKVAFDTRRINQETDYIPRRNLQFYHRSDDFINQEMENKIKNILKLKIATDLIKERFQKEPEWFDSYARVLSATIDRTLRVEQKDNDYSNAQMNYLNELLYMRYRLPLEQIGQMSERQVEEIILNKDEPLIRKGVMVAPAPPKIIKNTDSANPLIEKLLQDVKASRENKDVERSITITVRDKINDQEINKRGS